MLRRLLWGSLRHRRSRLGAATLAMLLGAAMVSALVNLSVETGSRAGNELRAYGANILVVPRGSTSSPGRLAESRGIAERDLTVLDRITGVVGYAPYQYLVAEIQGQPVVAAGVLFERVRAMSPWWQVTGRWPSGGDEALIGVGVGRALALAEGDRLTIGFQEARAEVVVVGLVETGGAEDNQVFVALPVAQTLSGRPGEVGVVQVSALATDRPPEQVAADIEARLPGVEARALRQLAEAEMAVLARVRLLMTLVAAMVLGVAALAVASTMVSAVLERKTEIGLMKALGATEHRVAAIYLAEGMSIGLLGGFGGYLAGLIVAVLVARQVFDAALVLSPVGFPATLGVALAVAVLASLWPVLRAMAVDPAVTLRGE